MGTEEFRYVSITTCNGDVVSSSGWDSNEIHTGMSETLALNTLGKKGYRPYKVTDHTGMGVTGKEQFYTTFRLCNKPLPQL